jgi:hypothetical protein
MYYLGFAGFVMLFFKPSDAKVFGIIYTALAWYYPLLFLRIIKKLTCYI